MGCGASKSGIDIASAPKKENPPVTKGAIEGKTKETRADALEGFVQENADNNADAIVAGVAVVGAATVLTGLVSVGGIGGGIIFWGVQKITVPKCIAKCSSSVVADVR
jgi:hypothetical protein